MTPSVSRPPREWGLARRLCKSLASDFQGGILSVSISSVNDEIDGFCGMFRNSSVLYKDGRKDS